MQETKTKAYSKEGLLASNPKEDSRNEARAWYALAFALIWTPAHSSQSGSPNAWTN